MTRNILHIISLSLLLLGVTACKQERKSNVFITKIAPKPHVPSGTKALDVFKYE